MRSKDICSSCDHYCTNNDDDLLMGCRAFPKGIPYHLHIEDTHSHDIPFREQGNDFVYMPAKREESNFGRKIEIYQDYNFYADEDGKYKRFIRELSEITIDNVTEEEMFFIRFRYENREDSDPEFEELKKKMIELEDFEDKVYTDEKYSKWYNKFLKDNQ